MQAESGTKGKFAVALWHGAGEPPPARLLVALRARGIATVEVNSAFMALAEVCSRLEVPPVGGKRSFGVVAVYPERLEGADTLWEALTKYAPGTRCWGFGPAGAPNQRLTPIVERAGDHPVPEPSAQSPRATRTAGPKAAAPVVEPKLKLTGPPEDRRSRDKGAEPGAVIPRGAESELRLMDDEAQGPDGDDGEPLSRRPLLSAEELSMLLDEQGEEERE